MGIETVTASKVAQRMHASDNLTRTRIEYRADIDGLRAVAVILVVLFHAFPEIGTAGFVGVDVFFVISGYLITQNLLGSPSNVSAFSVILNFYEHRLKRLFPALTVVLAFAFIYGWFFLFPTVFESLKKYIVAGAGFIANFVLWREAGYFDQAIEFKPLMHLWSLAIEEQFYIVWPLLILALRGTLRPKSLPYALGLLTICSFLYCLYITAIDPAAAYYSPLSRGWEIAIGGVLASIQRLKSTAPRHALAAIGLLLIIAAAFAIDRSSFPGWQAAMPVAGCGLVIFFGKDTVIDRKILGLDAFRYVGLISYPLYLWHWLLLSLLRIEVYTPSAQLRAVAVVSAVVLSVATFHFIERPTRRMKSRVAAGFSGVGMIAVFSIALVAYLTKSSGKTLTPFQTALASEFDARPSYRYTKCFLDTASQTGADFADECVPTNSEKPTFLLWGDSLAAQFYPGLRETSFGQRFSIAQTTATSCPPAADSLPNGLINCASVNDAARNYIAMTRPAYVLINGRWPSAENERRDRIAAIVSFLRSKNVSNIILAGPAPDWAPDIRAILSAPRFSSGQLPAFMPPPLDGWLATKALDESLRLTANELCIDYLSLISHFCKDEKCRTTVSDKIPEGLVTTDRDHLTPDSSIDLFKRLTASDLSQSCRKLR